MKIILMLMLSLVSLSSYATEDCVGDACNDVNVKWEDGCYVATNNSDKNTEVTFKGNATIILRIDPGKSEIPRVFGACIQGYNSPLIAKFK